MTLVGIVRFGPYHFDPACPQLSRDGTALPLPPKALAMLAYLLRQRGRVVGKKELLDTVWGRRFVSEGVLKNTVQTLRQALDDDPKAPRYVETVHRLGYRFIAEIQTDREPTKGVPAAVQAAPFLAGREDATARLRGWLEQARRGEPQLVFITGEAGIGKTALIDAFAVGAGVAVARGQCAEQHGQGEPYLPVLEALNTLARQDRTVAGLLRQAAPTWLAQLPWLLDEADRAALAPEMRGATQARMLREFGEFLECWTQERPLILALEDLHWSDHATLDLLAYLARRKHPARWLVLGSYRPVETALTGHPLKAVKRDLQVQGLCREVPLELLPAAAVAEYLAWRHPGRALPEDWARAVHSRSEGLPFFLEQLAESLPEPGGAFPSFLPEGLQQLIAQQFERLPPGQQRLLEAASVAGKDFSAEAVAAVLGQAASEVEESCEHLARLRHFLRPAEGPGGHYGFFHSFYYEFVHSRLSPLKKAELRLRLGQWLDARACDPAAQIAIGVVGHFDRGQELRKAGGSLRLGVGNAIARHVSPATARLL